MSKLTKSEKGDVYESVHSRMDLEMERIFNKAVANGMDPDNIPKNLSIEMEGNAAQKCYQFYWKVYNHWDEVMSKRYNQGKNSSKAERNKLMASRAMKYINFNFKDEINAFNAVYLNAYNAYNTKCGVKNK